MNLFDFDFMPDKIEATGNGSRFEWNGASISGTPVEQFVLKAIDTQTIDSKFFMSDLNLNMKFRMMLDNFVMNTDDFYMFIPGTNFDLTFGTGFTDLNLESALLAAFHVPIEEIANITSKKSNEWSCELFPKIHLAYIGLKGELKSPTVNGFFGKDNGLDQLINGVTSSFFGLFKAPYMDASSNFLGTEFLSSADDLLQNFLEEVEKRHSESCEQ